MVITVLMKTRIPTLSKSNRVYGVLVMLVLPLVVGCRNDGILDNLIVLTRVLILITLEGGCRFCQYGKDFVAQIYA